MERSGIREQATIPLNPDRVRLGACFEMQKQLRPLYARPWLRGSGMHKKARDRPWLFRSLQAQDYYGQVTSPIITFSWPPPGGFCGSASPSVLNRGLNSTLGARSVSVFGAFTITPEVGGVDHMTSIQICLSNMIGCLTIASFRR